MSHDDSGHCYFIRQPETPAHADAAIRALWSSCCGAVRYAGKDQLVQTRIAELGEPSACDEELNPTPPQIVRNCVTCVYRGAGCSPEVDLRMISRSIADSLPNRMGCRCSDSEYEDHRGSFVYHWGSEESQHPIRFRIEARSEGSWLVSTLGNERAKIGTAMALDTALQASDSFVEIRWFTEDEEDGRGGNGAAHPY